MAKLPHNSASTEPSGVLSGIEKDYLGNTIISGTVNSESPLPLEIYYRGKKWGECLTRNASGTVANHLQTFLYAFKEPLDLIENIDVRIKESGHSLLRQISQEKSSDGCISSALKEKELAAYRYLAFYPDLLINAAKLPDGWQHYNIHGKAENRTAPDAVIPLLRHYVSGSDSDIYAEILVLGERWNGSTRAIEISGFICSARPIENIQLSLVVGNLSLSSWKPKHSFSTAASHIVFFRHTIQNHLADIYMLTLAAVYDTGSTRIELKKDYQGLFGALTECSWDKNSGKMFLEGWLISKEKTPPLLAFCVDGVAQKTIAIEKAPLPPLFAKTRGVYYRFSTEASLKNSHNFFSFHAVCKASGAFREFGLYSLANKRTAFKKPDAVSNLPIKLLGSWNGETLPGALILFGLLDIPYQTSMNCELQKNKRKLPHKLKEKHYLPDLPEGTHAFSLTLPFSHLEAGMQSLDFSYRYKRTNYQQHLTFCIPAITLCLEHAIHIKEAGVVIIQGWAFSHVKKPIMLSLHRNGASQLLGSPGSKRPDLLPALGLENSDINPGFVFFIPIDSLSNGDLSLTAWDGCGNATSAPIKEVHTQDSACFFEITKCSWNDDGSILKISGAALNLVEPVIEIVAYRDGKELARTYPNRFTTMPDIPMWVRHADYSGFELEVTDQSLSNKDEITFVLIQSKQRQLVLSKKITVPNRPVYHDAHIISALETPPEIAITSGQKEYRISGWAFDVSENTSAFLICVYDESGNIVGKDTPKGKRPDVSKKYLQHKTAILSGFSVVLPLSTTKRTSRYQVMAEIEATGKQFFVGDVVVHSRPPSVTIDPYYEAWWSANAPQKKEQVRANKLLGSLTYKPLISVVMPCYNPDANWLKKAVLSVATQWYPNFELCIADDGSHKKNSLAALKKLAAKYPWVRIYWRKKNGGISAASNDAAGLGKGEYLLFLDQDDALSADCLFEMVRALNAHPKHDILYSDHDKIDEKDRHFDPEFKPAFSPEKLLSHMYMGHALMIRRSLFKSLGGFRTSCDGAQDYDLVLRAVAKRASVLHVPRMLYHWRAIPGSTALSGKSKDYSFSAGILALKNYLDAMNYPYASVTRPRFATKNHLGVFHVEWSLPKKAPSVSILIPTRNRWKLLDACLKSIAKKTTYPNYNIIIIDDRSDDPSSIKYFQTLPHKVLHVRDTGQGFNYSALINLGVEHAKGEFIALLNNDVEILSANWLQEMVGLARLPNSGVVGGLLTYPNGKVQHAGIILGMHNGLPGHPFKGLTPSAHRDIQSVKNVSAVTFAAAVMRRSVYETLSGLNAKHFPVAYQDPDFCLRAREKNYRNIYTPFAEFKHLEGESKPSSFDDSADAAAFLERWPMKEPYLNPHLSPISANSGIPIFPARRTVQRFPEAQLHVGIYLQNTSLQGAPLHRYGVLNALKQKNMRYTISSAFGGPLLKRYQALNKNVVKASTKEKAIKALFKKPFPDVIYANTLEEYDVVLEAKKNDIPVLWNIHESARLEHFFYQREEMLPEVRLALQEASLLVFVAEETRKLFVEQESQLADSIVIPNGVDVEHFSSKKLRSKKRPDGLPCHPTSVTTLGMIGTACTRKAQHLAVNALWELLCKNPTQHFKLLLIGNHSNLYAVWLKQHVKNLGIDPHVEWIDETDNISEWYPHIDMLLVPSYEESAPLVVLEAMASFVPVIASKTFGTSSQITHNYNGILINPGDVSDLVDSVVELMKNKNLKETLCKNALNTVSKRFDHKRMVAEYETQLRLLAEQRN